MALVDCGVPWFESLKMCGIQGKGLLYLVGIWIVACVFVSIYANIH